MATSATRVETRSTALIARLVIPVVQVFVLLPLLRHHPQLRPCALAQPTLSVGLTITAMVPLATQLFAV